MSFAKGLCTRIKYIPVWHPWLALAGAGVVTLWHKERLQCACEVWLALLSLCYSPAMTLLATGPGVMKTKEQPQSQGAKSNRRLVSKKINVCSCLYAAKHKTEQSLPRNTTTSILTTGLLIAPNRDEMKGPPIEWEKTFASHISDNGLISKICKEIIQFNSKNKNI